MRTNYIAFTLLFATSAFAEEARLERDSWKATSMEGAAFLGELKYQLGDISEARENFGDSLDSGSQVAEVSGDLMALDLFRTGELALANGDWRKAKLHWETLIGRYPKSEHAEKARKLLGALSRGGSAPGLDDELEPEPITGQSGFQLRELRQAALAQRAEEAHALAERFLSRYPHHAAAGEVRLLSAAMLVSLGRWESAADSLERVLANSTNPAVKAKARYLLSGVQARLGHCSEVRASAAPGSGNQWLALQEGWAAACGGARDYDSVAGLPYDSPMRAFALAKAAEAEDASGRPKAALTLVAQAEALSRRWDLPELTADLSLAKAHLLQKLKRLPEAAGLYDAFASAHPNHPEADSALYQAALTLRRMERPGEAAAAFRRLLARFPDHRDARVHLGQLLERRGRPAEALAEYAQVPGPEGLLLQAQAHYNRKAYREAIPFYRDYLELNPGDRAVAQLLLTCYWQGDRDDPGILALAERYPAHPVSAHAVSHHAQTKLRAGDHAGAEALMRLLTERYPGSKPAQAAARVLSSWRAFDDAKSHEAKGEWKQAIAAYRRSVGRPAQAGYRIAACFEKLKDKKNALRAYQDLWALRPRSDPFRLRGLLRLGLLQELSRKPMLAMKAYAEVLKHGKGDPSYSAAARRVSALTADKVLLKGR